ncbi:hypothetical protein ABE61_20280 [Lysinibacillus sphaericus]|nr:hypothetical protein [Lysinibacillus sphaericus]MBG9479293.1 hypothetical protein [Lysinibacillus sphaericus]MBG9594538.1 hypothetical protein [Lysinibacillus sphaericus]
MRKRSANEAAANVLSARKRSVSGKAPSRNGNHLPTLPKSQKNANRSERVFGNHPKYVILLSDSYLEWRHT